MITLCMIIVKLVIPTTLDNCYESGDAKKKGRKNNKRKQTGKTGTRTNIYIYIFFILF